MKLKKFIGFKVLLILVVIAAIWLFFHSKPGVGLKPVKRIILISIDTLRADHLGCYGYPHKTSPNLDAFANESILFETVVSAVPLTLPSHSTMLTGTIPPYHGVRDNLDHQLDKSNLTLAEILKDKGFATCGIVSAYVLDAVTDINQGFETYLDDYEEVIKDAHDIGRRAHEATKLASDWLEKHCKDEKFFLFLHYYDPHTPYDPPEPFASTFAENLYDGEIAYTDNCIGVVIKKLKELGIYDSAMIIVTSDHGEMLGEHGESEHGFFIYESAIKVPLIIKMPSKTKPKRISELVGLVDIVPAVCSVTKIPVPNHVQGKDLSVYFKRKARAEKERYIYCESLFPTKHEANSLLGVMTKRWKYIQTKRPELYDISNDPAEENNLLTSQSQRAHLLRENLKLIMEKQSYKGQRSNFLTNEESRAKLESLGYIGGRVVSGGNDFDFDPTKYDPKDLIYSYEQEKKVKVLLKVKRYEEAKLICTKIVAENNVNDLYFIFALGEIAVNRGNWDEAISHLSEVIYKIKNKTQFIIGEKSKELSRIYQLLAQAYFEQEKFDKALESLNEALQITPNQVEVLNNIATIKLKSEEPEKAIEYWKNSLQIDPNQLELYNHLAQCYYKQGQPDQAKKYLRDALKIEPNSPGAHSNLANVLLKQGEFEEAISLFEKAIELDPDIPQARENLQEARKQKKISETISSLQESLRNDPNQPELHNKLGMLFYSRGDLQKTIYHWDMALQLKGDQVDLLNNLAYIIATQTDEFLKNPQKAIQMARRACELTEFKKPEILDTLAVAYAADGRFTEAIETIQKAIDLAVPSDNQAFKNELKKRLDLYECKKANHN